MGVKSPATCRSALEFSHFQNCPERLTVSCSHETFMMISQTVQELSHWQTCKHTHPQTDATENTTFAMLLLCGR